MHELAFGTQNSESVQGSRTTPKSHVKRHRGMGKGVYGFVAKRFGEDNIISFYVHLDEKNPHIHCTVVPVNDNNRISWKSVFVTDGS
jgi:hypothetical protein